MGTIAIDITGADKGPEELIKGINDFKKRFPKTKLIVVGEEKYKELLSFDCEYIVADDILPMDAGALEVMRHPESSMVKAISLVADGEADAVVSAGSTGALISASTIKLRLIDGVERAALVSPFPKVNGDRVIILDIGANTENTAEHLIGFAIMGKAFAKVYLDKENVKAYLLSNGAEEGKGSPTVKEAHRQLKEANFEGFEGNIEARYVLNGDADVVVSSGYDGNIFLKSSEGLAKMYGDLIKRAFKKNIFTKIGYLFAKGGFKELKNKMNYKYYGGAVLLGVNGLTIKAHGSSDAYSFEKALELANKMIDFDLLERIKEEFNYE